MLIGIFTVEPLALVYALGRLCVEGGAIGGMLSGVGDHILLGFYTV